MAEQTSLTSHIKQLASAQRWSDIVHELDSVGEKNAELNYQYGIALAQLGRLEDARSAFVSGRHLAPHDKRFAIELGGVAFKQKRYADASDWLRRALRIDPADSYANDFLATVYFLEGNLEAALKYWNRVGKPYVEEIRPDHQLQVRPVLLDRALAFSPADELRLEDFLTTRARLEGLEIFPAPRVQLAARPQGHFDVMLNLQERNGWGENTWQALISTFSGVAYQTIYPAYYNLEKSAVNLTSLIRWDPQKRRFNASISGPLHLNPRRRWRVGVDLRNENWDIRNSFTGPSPSLSALNLRREAGEASIESINSGRWGWSAGFELSHRDYRSVVQGSTLPPTLLLEGLELKQIGHIHFTMLRFPEHRFVMSSAASSQIARIWSQPAQAFGKLQGAVAVRWLPQAQGDDYETSVALRAGGTAGDVPFDELYMLGMERDNDLWMRAHIGTRDGRKGSAPLGRNYFLLNSEIDKNIYGNGLIALKVGPFLDTGTITGSSGRLGAQKWLWDTGIDARVRVLGVGLAFIYGKDLRSGNNAFYFTAERRPAVSGNME